MKRRPARSSSPMCHPTPGRTRSRSIRQAMRSGSPTPIPRAATFNDLRPRNRPGKAAPSVTAHRSGVNRSCLWPKVLLAAVALALASPSADAAGISKGPYLQLVSTRSVMVCWVSDDDEPGTVRFGAGHESGRRVDDRPRRLHRVTLKGLDPYTRYRYSVECGGQTAQGSFTTAPPAGQPFHFAVYGDTRTDPAVHAAVLARMLTFHPDFVIQTGDLVADGTDESLWSEFFSVAAPILRAAPYYPALGNHERGGDLYLHYFAVPREYSFDYGDMHFAALDSNRPESEYADQERWLKQDLAAHQKARWRVVFFHHTPYTCVDKPNRRILAELLRARLEPILLAGKVQLVFNGHDHDYQHHFAHGVHYVVTGGG